MKIAVIGAGLIGRAWSIAFARGGHEVVLWDQDVRACDAALAWAKTALADMQAAGLIDDPQAIGRRIGIARSLADAVANADHVQENIAERLDAKRGLFVDIAKYAKPGAVLASSSSAILPSLIFEELESRHRCLVAHPMNPPHLAPFVELCGAPFTDRSAVETTRTLMSACGMAPIVVNREIEGFVLNRLQHALLCEAFRLIANGYVAAGDLDKALKDGLALRWSFMGPIETIDLNAPGGVADYMERYAETVRGASNPQTSGPDWPNEIGETLAMARRADVPLADLARAQAWRDQRLMALVVHKKDAEKKFRP